MGPEHLVIIGAGPSCTYVLERIAAYATSSAKPFDLTLTIFERSGQFGAGQVHSTQQPKSSFLNRIAGQVSFAADETIENSGPLLPKNQRLALHEWCQEYYKRTNDEAFNLKAEDWPKRYIHGMALKDSFERYCEMLRQCPYIELNIHHAEVVDVIEIDSGYQIVTDTPSLAVVPATHILFATGHSFNDPTRSEATKSYVEFSNSHPALYVPSAYPLEYALPSDKIGPETVVGCDGMGLTAIDIVLYLTEGRGGVFERNSYGKLEYQASGLEPSRIIPFSGSGLFTFARPFNAKEKNLDELEHKGIFLTDQAIDELRETVGVPISIPHIGIRNQLDFERHIWPLMVMEMSHLYYKTLLGNKFAKYAQQEMLEGYRSFLSSGGDGKDMPQVISELLVPMEKCVDEVSDLVDPILLGQKDISSMSDKTCVWGFRETFNRFIEVVYGNHTSATIKGDLAASSKVIDITANYKSPFGHFLLLSQNKFSWISQINPLGAESFKSPEQYQTALLQFMHKDHLWAAQNNLDNPAKAAADGVWRDLRPVLAHAADFGGLSAKSHQVFLEKYMHHHNRLCNGAALEVMEKILALLEVGLLDASVGPDAKVQTDHSTGKFHIVGSQTGAHYQIDCLIDAKVHAFDPEKDIRHLYPNLYRRGLIQKWENPSSDGTSFRPGGLTLTPDFHPIRANGYIDRRLTFLGPPTEGVMFFQLGALRPNKNHHVMQDILHWFRDFWEEIIDKSDSVTQRLAS